MIGVTFPQGWAETLDKLAIEESVKRGEQIGKLDLIREAVQQRYGLPNVRIKKGRVPFYAK